MKPKKTFRFFPHLRHAMKMVSRNRKTYVKMSVTVVLAFTILLAYMALTDASLYNSYARVLSLPRQVVQSYSSDAALVSTFMTQVKKNDPDAKCYSYFITATEMTAYEQTINADCCFIPDGIETLYSIDNPSTYDGNMKDQTSCAVPIKLIGEKQDFLLEKGQAIVNEGFYQSLLAGGAEEPVSVPVTFHWDDGSYSIWDVEVVGVCEDSIANEFFYIPEDDFLFGYVSIYLSQSQIEEDKSLPFSTHVAFVSSESPEEVMNISRALGLVTQGIAEAQTTAKSELQSSIQSKALTACVMLALLAICLYSSLSNVLETRNFEIGVKRAIGASSFSIVRQFLYELLLVLGFDIILSAALVADLLVVYKLVQKAVYNITWIAYISPYSIAIYAISTLSLTVTFSLIFAYRSTRVEIVQYLKAE